MKTTLIIILTPLVILFIGSSIYQFYLLALELILPRASQEQIGFVSTLLSMVTTIVLVTSSLIKVGEASK